MVKSSGLGDNFYVAGFDLSGDVGALDSIHGGNSPLIVTGIDKSAPERIGGLRDGAIDFSSFFNDAAAQEHVVLKPTAFTGVLDWNATYCRGTALGGEAAFGTFRQLTYDPTRGTDGSLTIGVSLAGNGFGLDWGRQLTAGKRTDSAATSPATGVDFTDVTTLFGWQAMLQVFAFTGTSVTVTLQDSADNSAFTSLTGGGFTAATGATSQRIAGGRTATVRRYVRAITTGTFSNAVFAVAFNRNVADTPF